MIATEFVRNSNFARYGKLRMISMSNIQSDRPKLQVLLERKEIFQAIQKKISYPVIWLEGPPGSGKTTLINSYLQYEKIPCIWYRLTEADNDIAVFLNTLSTRLTKYKNKANKNVSLLSLPYRPENKPLAKSFIKELNQIIETPISLVFDDYHVIDNPDFHEMFVEAIIQLNLSEINIFIMSRHTQTSSFSRLREKKNMKLLEND